MNQKIDLLPVDEQQNYHAREAARHSISWPVNLTPASVSYQSDGHVLILGNELHARLAAHTLDGFARDGHGPTSITLVFTEAVPEDADVPNDDLLAATAHLTHYVLHRDQLHDLRIEGHLGQFSVSLMKNGTAIDLAKALADRSHFDAILDMGRSPVLTLELPPPGYVAMRWSVEDSSVEHSSVGGHSAEDRDDQLEAFAGLVGEFDKPRYFQINKDLCAHSSSGNVGCTRCLEVCPADAITSHQGRIEAWIEIDPFRCQGLEAAAVPALPVLSSSACPRRIGSRRRSWPGLRPTAGLVERRQWCVSAKPKTSVVKASLLDMSWTFPWKNSASPAMTSG